jgi:hypothetical protein
VNLVTFTVEEANKLLPELSSRMERLVETRRALDELQARVQVLTLAVSGASKDNPDALELGDLQARRGPLAEIIAKEVSAIHEHGCVVKDLDQGLIDFYALAGDRLVFLCWKLGEREVSHWHPLDGGFEQRQSLKTEIE